MKKNTTTTTIKANRVYKGKPAQAGKTKSILQVLSGNKISRRPATTIKAGGGGRAARTRGGANPNSRANTSSGSISH